MFVLFDGDLSVVYVFITSDREEVRDYLPKGNTYLLDRGSPARESDEINSTQREQGERTDNCCPRSVW
jgi:hypothetical protein